MNKLQKLFSGLITAVMLFQAVPALAEINAAGCDTVKDPLCVTSAVKTGLGSTDIRVTIASIIKVAMGLLGIVAVAIILIGGFTWMTAGGNEEKVGEAKKWIFAGIIGLAIILSAYALATFVINSLVTATGFNPNP